MTNRAKFHKFLHFWLILAIILLFLPKLQAQELELLNITAISIAPLDKTVKITWSTNFPSHGRINYGLTISYGSWIEDAENDDSHEMWLSGLTPNTKYYFNFDLYDIYQRHFTTASYQFTTQKENDITAPILSDISVSYITANSATFVWYTDELANTCVYYGLTMDNLNLHPCTGGWTLVHDFTIGNLAPNTTYYYRAYSKDKANNGAYSVYYSFHTEVANDATVPPLQIYQTTYVSENINGSASTTISFQTNRPISGKLKWGDRQNRHNHNINLPTPRTTDFAINITGLLPNKDYYYILDIKDILNQHLITPEYVFYTPNPNPSVSYENLEYNPYDPEQDFDADGLTNVQEELYSTSQIKADTDGDGYIDGVEVRYGYNPLGPGKLVSEPAVPAQIQTFAYNQPRVLNLQTEINAANELKYELEQLFNGPIPVNKSGWPTLVNAYVYGGYPVEAIYQAIIYSGKTVHPTIPWSAWQNSDDYQTYINL